MTLVLSVTTCNGVAMAADSTVTAIDPSTGKVQTTPSAAKKLMLLKSLSCGVGMWGRGQIESQDTDKWFEDFLTDADNTRSITILAHRLAARLDESIPRPRNGQSTVGFLICGLDRDHLDENGKPLPVCWHVHDGPSTTLRQLGKKEPDPNRVNANQDIRPGVICSQNGVRYETRNGDYQPYALADEALMASLDLWNEMFKMRVPRSTLPLDEANFLAFKIRLISDLYQLSHSHPIIGGRVDWLAIDPDGCMTTGALP